MLRWYFKDFNFLLPRFWFGQVDSRPLSLFRILFALVMLKDAVYHLFIAEIFYSDGGVFPRQALLNMSHPTRFSIMDSVGEAWVAQVIFGVWIVVLIGLLVGYRTRWMTILHFLLILSIHERNVWILNGGDTLLRVLSFWMLFIPLGQYYSLDALRRRRMLYLQTRNAADWRVEDAPRTCFAFPVRMMQMQFALVYIFTFVLKLPFTIWRGGEAVHYALQLESLTLPTGDWVFAHAPFWMLQGMNYFTLVMEGSFVFLVFLPFWQPLLRVIGLGMGVMLHLGIAVLMSIDNFSSIMIMGYAIFLLPSWVSALDGWLRSQRQPLILPMPAGGSPLWWLLGATRADEIALAERGENQGAGRDDWIVLDRAGGVYRGKAAWRQAAAHLPLSRAWGWLLTFGGARRLVWEAGRWAMGADALLPLRCAEPTPIRQRWALLIFLRATTSLALGTLMACIVWWNLADVYGEDNIPAVRPVPQAVRELIQYTGLWQNWAMFAPYPVRRDGWVTIPGRFEDGTVLDLMTGKPPIDDHLRWLWGPGLRWKKLISNIYFNGGYEPILLAWGSRYCRIYNSEHHLPVGKRLATLEIHYRWRESFAPDGEKLPLQTDVLWRHWCFEEYKY